MRSLNLSITSISSSISQFMKGNDLMSNKRMLRALLLASLIATLTGLANAQSSGRWVGRIQLAPQATPQSSSGAASARHDVEETNSQPGDRIDAASVFPSG